MQGITIWLAVFTIGLCCSLAEAHADDKAEKCIDKRSFKECKSLCGEGEKRICLELLQTNLKSEARLVEVAEAGCNADHIKSCLALGLTLFDKANPNETPEHVQEALGRACRAGEGRACYPWVELLGRGTAEDSERLTQILTEECETENWAACAMQARRFEKGQTVERDLAKARSLYDAACTLDPAMCKRAGVMWRDGIGGERDLDVARKHLERACEAAQAGFCLDFAMILLDHAPERAEEAIEFLKSGCSAGERESCQALHAAGSRLMNGELGTGSKEERERGRKLWEEACEYGNGVSCRNLALLFHLGEEVARDSERALELSKKGCQLGDEQACLLTEGIQNPAIYRCASNTPPRLEDCQAPCEEGHPTSCYNVAVALAKRHKQEPLTDSELGVLEAAAVMACDNDVSGACSFLGWHLFNGGVLRKDYTRAAVMLQKACDLDNGQACAILGHQYENGHGVPANIDTAVELYSKGCGLGDETACRHLAYVFAYGIGVDQDESTALKLYAANCQGPRDLESCVAAGLLKRDGVDGQTDAKGAASFFKVACDRGFVVGCDHLGDLYSRGDGVEKDQKKANALFERVCDETGQSLYAMCNAL